MKKALIAGCILSGLAASAAPSVALPPFTITGRVVNYGRQSVSEVSSGNAEIRAYKSDGTLVARSQIATEENLVENYRRVIPLSSSESPTSASVGEKLSFQVQQQDVGQIQQLHLVQHQGGLRPPQSGAHHLQELFLAHLKAQGAPVMHQH